MADKSAERVLVVPTAMFHQAGSFKVSIRGRSITWPRLLDPGT